MRLSCVDFYASEGTSGGILKSHSLSLRFKSCLSNSLKTTETNLMNFHRKIKHNEKVCYVQELNPYTQGQGHSRVKGQIVP